MVDVHRAKNLESSRESIPKSADPGRCKGERVREERCVFLVTTTTATATAAAAATATTATLPNNSNNSDPLAGIFIGPPSHRSRTSIHRLRGFCFTGGGSFPESLRSTWGSLGCPSRRAVVFRRFHSRISVCFSKFFGAAMVLWQ